MVESFIVSPKRYLEVSETFPWIGGVARKLFRWNLKLCSSSKDTLSILYKMLCTIGQWYYRYVSQVKKKGNIALDKDL